MSENSYYCEYCNIYRTRSELKFWDGDERQHWLCPGCYNSLVIEPSQDKQMDMDRDDKRRHLIHILAKMDDSELLAVHLNETDKRDTWHHPVNHDLAVWIAFNVDLVDELINREIVKRWSE